MAQGRRVSKKRSASCYQTKIDKLTKQWRESPKLQEKVTLDKWLSGVKKPTKE